MKRSNSFLISVAFSFLAFVVSLASAQEDVIVFRLPDIFQCNVPSTIDREFENQICDNLLQSIIDDLNEAESFLEQLFVGYSNEVPAEFTDQLGACQIKFLFEDIDGPGGVMVTGRPLPDGIESFPAQDPEWFFSVVGEVLLDVNDIELLLNSNRLVEFATRGALEALGFPTIFEMSGLIVNIPMAGENYIGVNGGGFGLEEYRMESDDPSAPFVPLDQTTNAEYLCRFESTFVRTDIVAREILTPPINPTSCSRFFMSRTLRGMFADLGYSIPGTNAPGIIDVNGDALDDSPLFIRSGLNPMFPMLGDVNGDNQVDLLDVTPFVEALSAFEYQCEADMNVDGRVDLLDIAPFVDRLLGI